MKYYLLFLLGIALAFTSCENKPKLTPEQIEAMKQAKLDSLAEIRFSDIDKEEVDTYPLFRGICDSATTKIGQKECFEKTFASLLLNSLKKDNYSTQLTVPIEIKVK